MSKVKWVRLGDYIIQRREKNVSNELPIYGVTRDGFILPKVTLGTGTLSRI